MFLLSFLILSSYADSPKTAAWPWKPNIVVCKESTVKVEDIELSMKYWENKGHEFGTVEYANDCIKYHSGYILFVGDESLGDLYAGATEVYDYNGRIASAYIEIWDGANTDLKVIVHELGHALGYEHSHDKNNIMYKSATESKVNIRR